MNNFFDELWFESLNGGAPITDARSLPGDWHEIKAWAETLLRANSRTGGAE